MPRDRLGQQPPSDRLAESIDCSWAIFSKPPGFLRSSSQIAHGRGLLVDHDHPAAQLSPYCDFEGFLQVLGR